VPTTFVGLVIFVAFLTPGFLHSAQRRALVPQAERSALMETTAVVSVSFATNAVMALVFGVVRWVFPEHAPDVGQLLTSGSDYWIEHLPYVLTWATVLLAGSCALAVLVARSERLRRRLSGALPPVIIQSSAWCEVLNALDGSYTHAGLELTDGAFVSGRVVWFSTELEETGDRDLVLGPPLQLRTSGGARPLDVQRVVIAARDIRRIDVTYIAEDLRPAR
jgi:hypothetical protein